VPCQEGGKGGGGGTKKSPFCAGEESKQQQGGGERGSSVIGGRSLSLTYESKTCKVLAPRSRKEILSRDTVLGEAGKLSWSISIETEVGEKAAESC